MERKNSANKNDYRKEMIIPDGEIVMDIKTEPEVVIGPDEETDMDEINEIHLNNLKEEKKNMIKPKFAKKVCKKYKQIRPKVITEWSHDDIMKLINGIKDRPSLWDINSEQYKMPKAPAWEEMAKVIGGRTADECKAKWANLRVTFKTNKRKKQQFGSAAGGPIIWKYFNAMKFLDVNEISQTSESYTSITQLSEEVNASVIESEPKRLSQRKSIKKVPSSPPLPSSFTKSDAFKEIVERAICAIDEKIREKDQFDAFGNYIAAELRSLPQSEAILAKRKLARVLVDIMDEAQNKAVT